MTKTDIPTIDALKAQAKRLRGALSESGQPIAHAAALEAVARQWGYRDWNTLSAAAQQQAQSAPALPRWYVGQAVQGRYLGHAFTGKIKAAQGNTGGYWRLTLVFDEPVDVVASAHFSNFRKQVNCTVNSQGVTATTTSDGQPHVTLRAV